MKTFAGVTKECAGKGLNASHANTDCVALVAIPGGSLRRTRRRSFWKATCRCHTNLLVFSNVKVQISRTSATAMHAQLTETIRWMLISTKYVVKADGKVDAAHVVRQAPTQVIILQQLVAKNATLQRDLFCGFSSHCP